MNIKLANRQKIVKLLLEAYDIPQIGIDIVMEEMEITFTDGRIYQAELDVNGRNKQRLYDVMPNLDREGAN